MSDNERLVSFELLGQEYKFYTAASDDELRSVFAMVRELMETGMTAQKTGTLPMGKMAILACLNIASRYVKLHQEFEAYKLDSRERLTKLREEIRSKLIASKLDGKG
jgi:cell division protein ZapA